MSDRSSDDDAALVGGRSGYAVVNGVRLHYVEAGEGPLVILLHGFPNYWLLWRRQIPALVAAGCRVVAPDLRGYNLSDKPAGIHSYGVAEVARDVAELIGERGAANAIVAGHDWGGVVAWRLARQHPTVVRGLAVLNAPHPGALRRELRRPGQLARSSYALFFQLPWFPERILRAREFAILERLLRRDPSRADAFTDDDVRRHVQSWRRPGALTGALNYYRALRLLPRREARATDRPLDCPVLVLWGMRDRYLSPRLLRGLERWAPRRRVVRIAEASHWTPADAAERVSRELVAFARAPAGGDA